MSTLLDLIQTKVDYVVQEATVVIRDIFCKYSNKYESIIATLCENLRVTGWARCLRSYDLDCGRMCWKNWQCRWVTRELPGGFSWWKHASKFSSVPYEIDVWGRISGKIKVRQFCVSELICLCIYIVYSVYIVYICVVCIYVCICSSFSQRGELFHLCWHLLEQACLAYTSGSQTLMSCRST